ncbi:hypothetical protein Cgig2_000449 [Carnegiea gigantea]|uniref:1,3-beta-glucan synthase n=1 Tax=Carnegiea gigantea TaxID=171969 RepID=A0A9Q1K4R3_9CARY|nr:hypothetical protein Cgig2_000449 [Carnegiea gigantea]
MSGVEEKWERLVWAALRSARGSSDSDGKITTGIARNVPSSLANSRVIDEILKVADEIQDEDHTVARILCEHAYTMAQNLDPDSEGRGVLQFKTGLMSVIKQKLSKREGGTIDRSQDIARLQEFYSKFRDKRKVDKLMADEMKLRESGVFSGNLGELERKTRTRKRVFATLKVLGDVLEQMTKEASPQEAEGLIPEELKRVMESDAAMTEDVVAYNIIPVDTTSIANAIVTLSEVRAAVSALKDVQCLPKLPRDLVPPGRSPDMLDFLLYTFGFQIGDGASLISAVNDNLQKDNVSNQREHVIHLLANEQSRLRIPAENEPKLDEAAVQSVFLKSLDNYVRWCSYLVLQPVWRNQQISQLLLVIALLLFEVLMLTPIAQLGASYQGTEAVIRIFMAGEIIEILRQQVMKQADSCKIEDGVSFLEKVIFPVYEVVAAVERRQAFGLYSLLSLILDSLCWDISSAVPWSHMTNQYNVLICITSLGSRQEAANNDNGRAPHSAWRNYDDFNEYFWSLRCFELSWPWRKSSPFFTKPKRRSKIKPLVKPTLAIVRMNNLQYSWHSFISRNNYNVLSVVSIWAPIYLLDIYVFYTILSAVCGFMLGARDGLGEIRSLDALQELFEKFPPAFMVKLHALPYKRVPENATSQGNAVASYAQEFWKPALGSMASLPSCEQDDYMKYAVMECYHSIKVILMAVLEEEGRKWVERLYEDMDASIAKNSIHVDFDLNKLSLVIQKVTALMGVLQKGSETSDLKKGAVKAVQDLYDVIRYDVLAINMRDRVQTWNIMSNAQAQGNLFSDLKCPKDPEVNKVALKGHRSSKLTTSGHGLQERLRGASYFSGTVVNEWKNFLARIGRDENAKETELFDNPNDIEELRFWASYRGQTLARTGVEIAKDSLDCQGFELSPEARGQADLKFTYVVTCQIYGKQREEGKPEAADIALLMQRNEALRVAFIDVVETLKDGKVQTEYHSKLVKADINGKDKEIYSIKLPGNPKLGEGKPENQNHAIVFTRGQAVQTIDMNQDNYFEEALKMRNLLEEFHHDHGIHPPTILGVREHVFTGSVSSLASFMSNQESSFVTLGQRVLANPLKVRMHYGHPDVFDRVFHITRGGVSKASRVINISEDIYIGKGRDVGLNQIALFEGKVAGGNGEQVLSRDVYRVGQLFDFFRMMSFYFTTVGYYFCTMLTVLTVYVFLYGKTYLALSGVGEILRDRARIMQNTALSASLNTQFLVQIGIFMAIPMILGFILEQGFFRAIVSFITMQFQLCSVFFTFSLGTRTHYFGRTILHGGAKYHATGRGFVVRHIKFSENYRLYSRSHFVKGFEVVLLLVVYLAYGYNDGGTIGYILLGASSWFMALSWLLAPSLFNPSGFEWQKTVEDFREWANWLMFRGGIGVKGHIRTLSGRIAETILSLRFLIFQYGIAYKLHVKGTNTSLTVYGFSWAAFAVLIVLFKVFTVSHKASVNFQLILRFVQGLAFLVALAGVGVAFVFTSLTIGDIFACILAFIPTGWAILSIAVAWKPVMKTVRLWKSIRSLARLYDAGMGILIFIPVAILSWFPFVSTFQTRLMFNQAFSRGLEISLILGGGNVNPGV